MIGTTEKKIKILFCIDGLTRGGTELQLVGLIERLNMEKYTPYLLTIRDTDTTLTPHNCQHLSWSVPSLFSFSGITALIKLIIFLHQEKIGVVQTFFQDSTLLSGTAAFLARVPVRIACFRDLGFWQNRKQAMALKQIYKGMSGFICNADIVREHFITHFDIERNKMQVLRNGIDVDALPYVDHSQTYATVGIVGNMTRQVKRTDLFIKAAAIVSKKYPEMRWHIIGDGYLRKDLETLAQALEVFDKIHFAGRVSDVADYLEKLDIGIISSDSEGLSNALLEYMFKGVTAVATEVGGNSELIEHEHTGLLVPPNDEHALASAIVRLIEDRSFKNQLAQAARQKAEQEYSWKKCVASHDHYYNTLLQQIK
jgi:glycosyltransferase involved in cell wall biosynthesis